MLLHSSEDDIYEDRFQLHALSSLYVARLFLPVYLRDLVIINYASKNVIGAARKRSMHWSSQQQSLLSVSVSVHTSKECCLSSFGQYASKFSAAAAVHGTYSVHNAASLVGQSPE